MIFEIEDRASRTKNLMLYNAHESESRDLQTRIDSDKLIVSQVLTQLNIVENPMDKVLKVIRVGPVPTNKKPRPIKIIFNENSIVKAALKNGRSLQNTGYKIRADYTKMQQDLYNNVKKELKERMQNGETDLIIQYRQGVPTITEKKNH